MLSRFHPAIGDVTYGFCYVHFVKLCFTREIISGVFSRFKVCNECGGIDFQGFASGEFMVAANIFRSGAEFTVGKLSLLGRETGPASYIFSFG